MKIYSNELNVDVLIDLSYGDSGKGKVSKYLIEEKINLQSEDINNIFSNCTYDAVAKFNGGGNSGHVVFIDDKKYTAHYLTSAVYTKDNTKILIGPGCVLNVKEFEKEVEEFEKLGFNVKNRILIHPFCHIITQAHIDADDVDNKIGSTKKGIGPAYAGKYARTNSRAIDIPELDKYVMKSYNFCDYEFPIKNILMEGSQGFLLDIDHGNYPFVTSSHMHPAFAFTTFGIPMDSLRRVYGVAKAYTTYVGSSNDIVKCDKNDEDIIRKIGCEYGATTGRPRKIGYLNLKELVDSINKTGASTIFINKCDVLVESNVFKLYDPHGNLCAFNNIDDLINILEFYVYGNTDVIEIYYGWSKETSYNKNLYSQRG